MSESKRARIGGETFEVFARDNPERPLQHIGTVQAENTKLAVARARMVYSERPWVEMCISPTSSFSGCLRPGEDGIVGMA